MKKRFQKFFSLLLTITVFMSFPISAQAENAQRPQYMTDEFYESDGYVYYIDGDSGWFSSFYPKDEQRDIIWRFPTNDPSKREKAYTNPPGHGFTTFQVYGDSIYFTTNLYNKHSLWKVKIGGTAPTQLVEPGMKPAQAAYKERVRNSDPDLQAVLDLMGGDPELEEALMWNEVEYPAQEAAPYDMKGYVVANNHIYAFSEEDGAIVEFDLNGKSKKSILPISYSTYGNFKLYSFAAFDSSCVYYYNGNYFCFSGGQLKKVNVSNGTVSNIAQSQSGGMFYFSENKVLISEGVKTVRIMNFDGSGFSTALAGSSLAGDCRPNGMNEQTILMVDAKDAQGYCIKTSSGAIDKINYTPDLCWVGGYFYSLVKPLTYYGQKFVDAPTLMRFDANGQNKEILYTRKAQ